MLNTKLVEPYYMQGSNPLAPPSGTPHLADHTYYEGSNPSRP
ncbi:MAG TPA: hypothetical protein VFH19_07015 [Nitrososphaeraceae archaeon]|jgi:hypothetical protein|nr:hypothetical protein [Nitrososphaeraceae archaeon]